MNIAMLAVHINHPEFLIVFRTSQIRLARILAS